MTDLTDPQELPEADPAFALLKAHVVRTTGLAYFTARDADLLARLRRRFTATGVSDYGRYLELLRDPATGEQEALVHELTIGETHFFRFQEQFDALRDHVIPELLRTNAATRQLRIWSAGCATGPEPYSVAILLEREFGAQLEGWSVSVYGTDLNRTFLRRAEEGVFAEWALRGLPDEIRRECFQPVSAGWQIAPRFRRAVRFAHHNLVNDGVPPFECGPAPLDIILCRNVMIYFSEASIRQVADALYASLVPGGWLLVGHAEGNLELFPEYVGHSAAGAMLFRKPHTPRERSAAASGRVIPFPPQGPPPIVPEPAIEALEWQPYVFESLAASVPGGVSRALESRPAPVDAPGAIERLRHLVDTGDWPAAERCSSRLREVSPLDPWVHFYHGLMLANTDRPEDAETAFRRALFLDPEFALAYYHLGLLAAARGEQPAAVRAFRNTLRALQPLPAESVVDGQDLTATQLRDAAELQLRELTP